MKNMKRFLTLFVVLSLMLSMTAFAAPGEVGTIKSIDIQNAAATATYVDGDADSKLDGDKNFKLTYNGTSANGMYMVFVLATDGVPTANNILYVNQEIAGGSSVTFGNVFPSEIKDSYIYVSGTDVAYTKVGKIVPNVEEVSVLKGDVTGDGKINMADYVAIRRWMVNKDMYPLTVYDAGDVTADSKINMADAIAIRRWMVNKDLYPFK